MKEKHVMSAIILAAGTSGRMGKLKQLLPLGDKTMLERVIHNCLSVHFTEVITVLGYQADIIQKAISIRDKRFRWVVNSDYLTGLSSSLKTGVQCLSGNRFNVMIFLGDMPYICTELIHLLLQIGEEKVLRSKESFVVRPVYNDTRGHPVFFGNVSKSFFMQIKGDTGAQVMMDSISNKHFIPVEDCGVVFDIDTPKAIVEGRKFF